MTENISEEEKAILQREELINKRERLKPELVLMQDGQEKEAYNMGDAAVYMLMDRVSFQQMLSRLKKQGRAVTTYQKSYGGIERYVLKETLDQLRTVVPKE